MKTARIIATKALGDGKSVTPEQLAKINKYAMVPLTIDQVYVRKYLVANNALDRDNERFSEAVLDDFAASLPGKGFFVEGHPGGYSGSGGPGQGLFFASYTEEMSVEQFTIQTGEIPGLPLGITIVKVLWGEAYILRLESNKDTLANIDGGIYRFVSIGFQSPFVEITGDRGNYIYGEYRPKGEAREASLVWLGAQVGAVAMKAAENAVTRYALRVTKEGGTENMKEFLKRLSDKLGKTITEENALDDIAAAFTDKAAEKDAEISALKPRAADGEAYRKSLIDDTIRFGVLISEIPTDEAGQKAEEEFLKGLPIERLKGMKEKFEKRGRETHPDKFTFEGKTEADRKAADTQAGVESPAVADAKKRAEEFSNRKGGK